MGFFHYCFTLEYADLSHPIMSCFTASALVSFNISCLPPSYKLKVKSFIPSFFILFGNTLLHLYPFHQLDLYLQKTLKLVNLLEWL